MYIGGGIRSGCGEGGGAELSGAGPEAFRQQKS